jgi:hypothetical protein
MVLVFVLIIVKYKILYAFHLRRHHIAEILLLLALDTNQSIHLHLKSICMILIMFSEKIQRSSGY